MTDSERKTSPEEARNELARRQDAGHDARVPLSGPAHLSRLTDDELRIIAYFNKPLTYRDVPLGFNPHSGAESGSWEDEE